MEAVRTWWVRLALIASLMLPVYFVVAAFGTKFGYLPWTVGFGEMTFTWGPKLMMAAAAFALVAVLLAVFVTPRKGIGAALVALLIPLAGIGYGLYVRSAAQNIPPIHDISTDLENPPGFSEGVVRARAAVPQSNDLDLLHKTTRDGQSFVDLQRENYPDITPVITGLDASRAFEIALDLARERGWIIGQSSAGAGSIEATDRSFWYGFTDDIVIRVRPEGTGARVDVRSVSRVGRSDLGANARRIRPYLQELRARFETAEQS